jgi:Transposase
LLSPHLAKVVACDPRHNGLLKSGNKSDKIDARKLADLLRAGMLHPVYHGQHSARPLKELSRSYLTLVHDGTRVMNRLKAIYRGQGSAAPANGSTLSATAPTGWSNYANRVYVSELSYSISNSTDCRLYASKPGALYWPRVVNIPPSGFFPVCRA